MAARSSGYGIGGGWLPDAELSFGFLRGHDARVPAWGPYQVDIDVVDGWEAVGEHRVSLCLDDALGLVAVEFSYGSSYLRVGGRDLGAETCRYVADQGGEAIQ